MPIFLVFLDSLIFTEVILCFWDFSCHLLCCTAFSVCERSAKRPNLNFILKQINFISIETLLLNIAKLAAQAFLPLHNQIIVKNVCIIPSQWVVWYISNNEKLPCTHILDQSADQSVQTGDPFK